MTRIVYGISAWLLWVFCKLWFRLRYVGSANVPAKGGVLLVSNHASFLDPLLAGTGAGRSMHFMARSTLGSIPIVGWWMRAVGVIFVDRDTPSRRSMELTYEALLAQRAVCIFPEGTRSRDGSLSAFKRGLLLLLKKSGATVVPVGIRGSFLALPPGKLIPRPRHCSVHYGEPMSAQEVMQPGGLDALRQRVADLCAMPLASSSDDV